ncbi:methyl-accepting chemotaxis protein [Alteromonas lipolytica]|uniref:methyl-accepting chemotaxis protein n=1 Tax=Alteromonas lipolytica TaxID=1856405 RepID=UPI003CC7D315
MEWFDEQENQLAFGKIAAMERSQAVIEFTPDGTIENANELFLNAMGYRLDEIKGQHHSMFVDSNYARSGEYKDFWQKLRNGEFHAGEYCRFDKQGDAIWIQASYNPVLDKNGKVAKVIKFATDITAEKMRNADFSGQLDAIGKSQAVIEFDLNGIILTANENFLNAMGYTLAEIKGQHHRKFVSSDYANSPEYATFWQKLQAGEFFSGEYQRFGKDNKEIWIQASYNPIMDLDGKPYKVVKYASDITEAKLRNADYAGQLEAIGKSQATIEFTPDGTIVTANENFLNTVGYTIDEIKGQHHRLFVEAKEQNSSAYKSFWNDLKKGKFFAGEFKRIGKNDEEVWIQASYNPIFDMNGKVFKVVKYATDITAEKQKNAYFEGQLDAISKSQAVIEFDLNGVILNANENFCATLGYSRDEIMGKHHSLFVEKEYKNSADYTAFWDKLNKGIYASGEFKRIAKGGREVFIQATYNPIMDQNGKPFRVVKFATDVTARTKAVNEIKHIMHSLSKGDLNCSIEQEFEGDFKELGQATEQFIKDMRTTIMDIKNVMTQLAAGDLTCSIEHEFEGDFQVLGEAINQFIFNMRSTIGEINTAVETINTASSEIASGNADLSSRTEQQASSLEETSSSMEELNGTVKLNAENAEQANGLAAQACEVAAQGGDMIRQVVTTMSSINESAQEISDIIGVIDGIAFQTNILALNAAVEAARAGEQGRGFAVVASEVRTLAQRSAEAAKDIKELISDSVSKITTGNELVNRSGDTMNDVVNSIKRVNDIMSEIAAASVQQASGIDEVSKAVVQMDEMTQQNAALVEEAAAAADSLRQQASQLSDRVSSFKLDTSAAAPVGFAAPIATRTLNVPPAAKKLNGSALNGSKMPPAMLKPSVSSEDDWESF